jgi:hypothetical protein
VSSSVILILALCSNVLAVLGGFALWMSYQRARHRPATITDEALATELRKLREGLDALAVEVERIGESQRFTARMLHEASTMRATFPVPGAKTITPH